MGIFDKIKSALGLTDPPENPQQTPRIWSQNEEQERFEPHRNFNVFTDPLEMHRYFEQQMDEMLRNFGFFGDGFTHFFNFNHNEDFPQIQDHPPGPEEEQTIPPGNNLRQQFLKPGFEKPKNDRTDEDIDGKLDIGDWGSVFKGENPPTQKERAPRNYFFGQSVTSKTITNPDGSIEIHRTVRDNQGNEETTITKKLGDKEYSIIKRKDKEGKEETIENLVNLDEREIQKFFPQNPKIPKLDDNPWPYFDRFFK